MRKKLIDKDALARGIENLKSNLIYGACASQIAMETRCKEEAYNEVLSFIDSLEVKEVDVEKESELIANSIMISVQANLYHTNVYDYEKRCYKHSDLKEAVRKGIELGLKTQKR